MEHIEKGKKKLIRKIIVFLVRIFSKVVFRVKLVGKENVPKEGAYIMCANHLSNWDPPIIVSCTKRVLHVMAKEELFKNKFIHWLAKKVCVFPVKRGKMDLESIKHSLKVLNSGEILMLFPEGTRKGLEKNGKAQNGAAFMALRTGVPVIPVLIEGKMKPFTKVTVYYGKPIDYSKYKTNKPDKELLEKISKDIMDNIIRLTSKQN